MDLPGTRIGRYQIVETLGSGGFSTVYRAVDEQLEADVALKVLAENHALDADVRERFFGEAQLLRRIQSPSVIAVHDVGETDRRQPYIVMGLAHGGDLGRRLEQLDKRGTTPGLGTGRDLTQSRYEVTSTEVLAVAGVLAASLGAAHEVGIVHRDVKPGNLLIVSDRGSSGRPNGMGSLLCASERLVLSDLGLAKDLAANSGLTVGAGTAGFAAPEQLVPTTTITRSVDIHAATAVVFWLLTRQLPANESAWEQIPAPLEPVLRRGLAADPRERFETMGEWQEAIRHALYEGRKALLDTSSRSRRVRLLLVVAGLVAVLAAAGAFGYVIGANRDMTTETVTDDGVTQVRASRSGVELTIRGPTTALAGEEALLQATTNSGGEIVWILPSGETTTGESLRLTTRRSGMAVITAATGVESEGAVVAEFVIDVR